MMEQDNLNAQHKALINSIDTRSAKALVELMKGEVARQTKALINSNNVNEDYVCKGGIRSLERFINQLEIIINKKDN